ncbi:MAG: hypothetical protein GY714_02555 [Desulfobacterales bacterium]|nr:hypothetical protein [Desulfobacterales bacterium]MCP4163017.1 hypothetical protein [Deltaproteobacteria bacterium]
MKKLSILLLIALSFSLFSCDSSPKNEKHKKKSKKHSIKTKAGMMERLNEFGFEIPEKFKFVKIKKKTSSYSVEFKAEKIDDVTKKELDEWYVKQISDLEANKWKKRPITVNVTVMGLTVNQHIFFKPKGGKSSLLNSIDLSSSYDPKNKSYSLFISPNNY